MAPALLLWTALLAAPASATGAATAPADLFAHPLTVDTLDNGLTLVTLAHDSPGVVSYFTLVRAGSRDEVEPGKSGYAHLFEHLMFRGTDQMPAAEYQRRMQAFGADNNAFTTADFTLYQPTLPKESLPELVRIEADRFEHLAYAPNAYKDETGAVLGEYNKNAANPLLPMSEALRGIAYSVHPYGHTTLGFKRDVEAMPGAYEYSRSFFRRFYTPDDCTIIAVGDVDHDSLLAQVKAAYGTWAGHRAPTLARVEPPQTAPRSRAIAWKGPTLPRLMVGFKIPQTGASVPDAAALAVVAALTFGESSELYQRLVVKEQKVIELESDPEDVFARDPGLFTVTAKLKPETTFDEIAGEIDAALAKVARGEAPLAKLEATRSHLVNALTLSLQTPQSIAIAIASWVAWTGDFHGLEAYRRALAAVTPDDVARVAKSYLVPARRNIVTLTGPATVTAPRAPATAGGKAK
jgi:zinc protease